jgi:hypothetical protein
MSTNNLSGSREIHHLDASNNTPPISIGPSGSGLRESHHLNILPDDVLLHIFHFDRMIYLDDADRRRLPDLEVASSSSCVSEVAIRHFASPNFLNLKLADGPRTRVELTGIWPPLPIIIKNVINLSVMTSMLQSCTITVCARLASSIAIAALTPLKLDCLDYYRRPAPALLDRFLQVCNFFGCIPFHSLRFRDFFCLQRILSASTFGIFLIPGTFLPRRSTLA